MTKRIRSKISRGSGELAILSLLAEEPLYGFEIARQIGERTGSPQIHPRLPLSPALRNGEAWVGRRTMASQPSRPRPPLLSPHTPRTQATCAAEGRMARLLPSSQQPRRSQPCLTRKCLIRKILIGQN